MEKLEIKYKSAKKSLNSLKILLHALITNEKILFLDFVTEDQKKQESQILQDSLIQRFEYSVDTTWKYLKEYLFVKKGVEEVHPKSVFRECLKAKLINKEESEKLIKMVDDRNLTSHTYNEILAKDIGSRIPKYYELMNKLIDTAQP